LGLTVRTAALLWLTERALLLLWLIVLSTVFLWLPERALLLLWLIVLSTVFLCLPERSLVFLWLTLRSCDARCARALRFPGRRSARLRCWCLVVTPVAACWPSAGCRALRGRGLGLLFALPLFHPALLAAALL
jgi:hypothetical protein